MTDPLLFQYCQKIVVFSNDRKSILLCRRKGEADYDSVYSFIGDKLEQTDGGMLGGLTREKDEEVGENFRIGVYTTFTTQEESIKRDGSHMILPHFFAVHKGGNITLNDEYDDYAWVPLDKLEAFEPKIPTVLPVVQRLEALAPMIADEVLVEI